MIDFLSYLPANKTVDYCASTGRCTKDIKRITHSRALLTAHSLFYLSGSNLWGAKYDKEKEWPEDNPPEEAGGKLFEKVGCCTPYLT